MKKNNFEKSRKLQMERLSELVQYARRHSPFFEELYRNLPESIEDLSIIPVTGKKELMNNFDDWLTDRSVSLKEINNFISSIDNIGEKFNGSFMVTTTSGTTGSPGIFLKDETELQVSQNYNSLNSKRWLGIGNIFRYMFRGGKTATIVATGGHFQSVAGFTSRKKAIAGSSKMQLEIYSVHSPIGELVRKLNKFEPGILMGYGSVISILANEQASGRLKISPLLIIPAGEGLSKEEKRRISETFKSPVHDFYGATECTFLSAGCEEGWYHINSEWAIAEPIDADNNPVEPGVQSHSVLITNLANHLQPIIRYNLGDSVVMRPDPCPCGNPHPALQVIGRSSDLLQFSNSDGNPVSVLPLALATLADGVAGITMYQLVQASADSLHLRLVCNPEENQAEIWKTLNKKMTDYLGDCGLANVSVELRSEAPEQSAGGKIRRIIKLSPQD